MESVLRDVISALFWMAFCLLPSRPCFGVPPENDIDSPVEILIGCQMSPQAQPGRDVSVATTRLAVPRFEGWARAEKLADGTTYFRPEGPAIAITPLDFCLRLSPAGPASVIESRVFVSYEIYAHAAGESIEINSWYPAAEALVVSDTKPPRLLLAAAAAHTQARAIDEVGVCCKDSPYGARTRPAGLTLPQLSSVEGRAVARMIPMLSLRARSADKPISVRWPCWEEFSIRFDGLDENVVVVPGAVSNLRFKGLPYQFFLRHNGWRSRQNSDAVCRGLAEISVVSFVMVVKSE